MKKFLSLVLATQMLASLLSGCGAAPEQTQTTDQPTTTAPAVTEPAAEAGVLKVLTLGHSLALDAGHMLALVANAEGYQEMKVATLYYSGCPLNKHVQFMTTNAEEYDLYISSTTDPHTPPVVTKCVTMDYAVRLDYWDVIIMQGGVFEIAKDKTYTDGNIQTIQEFVNENKLNPNAIFGWNMTWAPPTNNDLRDKYPFENNGYYTNYQEYNDDRTALYNAITKCVDTHIVPDNTFSFMIPSGTAMENALSGYMEEPDLHRDYVHATDFARVMTSYLWFCKLTGVEQLTEIKLSTVPASMLNSIKTGQDWVLTDAEKALMLESVNNALKNPLEMTQSQFTVAP